VFDCHDARREQCQVLLTTGTASSWRCSWAALARVGKACVPAPTPNTACRAGLGSLHPSNWCGPRGRLRPQSSNCGLSRVRDTRDPTPSTDYALAHRLAHLTCEVANGTPRSISREHTTHNPTVTSSTTGTYGAAKRRPSRDLGSAVSNRESHDVGSSGRKHGLARGRTSSSRRRTRTGR
jgi:hypothetical protein